MFKKILSVLLALCMSISFCAFAEEAADVSALSPEMDLICSASQYSINAPEGISAETALSESFVEAFLQVGCAFNGLLGITADTLKNTEAQEQLLSSVFASALPELKVLEQADASELDGYIGFVPAMVQKLEDGNVLVIGEIYMADQPIATMKAEDFLTINWMDRGLFILSEDATALNGYRVQTFALGTDLSYEEEMQSYYQSLVTEYESNLGFMLSYPAIFTDEVIKEDENGVSGILENGKASFFARRMDNTNGVGLSDYVKSIADGITGSVSEIYDEMQYATVAYLTDAGNAVFDVFVVTDKYIYQAEFTCSVDMLAEYSLYNSYFENSFNVNEVTQG